MTTTDREDEMHTMTKRARIEVEAKIVIDPPCGNTFHADPHQHATMEVFYLNSLRPLEYFLIPMAYAETDGEVSLN